VKPGYKLGASLFVLAMWGCGGGGGTPASSGSSSPVQAFAYGALSGRAAIAGSPVLSNSSSVSVVGLMGAISALDLRFDHDLAYTKIAFISDLDGHEGIYTISPDGSNPIRISKALVSYEAAAWSPDGSRIAFVSDTIYVMNADGSDVNRLTKSPGGGESPAWSPDGSRIAFVIRRSYYVFTDYAIFTMHVDGSHLTGVFGYSGSVAPPTWSPDGTRIATVLTSELSSITPPGTRPTYILEVANADSSQPTPGPPTGLILPTGLAGSCSWSPFPPDRHFIGATGQMGASASGLLFAQTGKNVTASIITFSQATTSQPLTLTSPSGLNSSGTALLYDLETAANFTYLTDLRYWNLTDSAPVQVPLSGGPVAKGALISFGAQDGLVHSVLLFNTFNRSAAGSGRPEAVEANGQRMARGHFVGVLDGKGKNLAPQGASEVTMDVRTGEVLQLK